MKNWKLTESFALPRKTSFAENLLEKKLIEKVS